MVHNIRKRNTASFVIHRRNRPLGRLIFLNGGICINALRLISIACFTIVFVLNVPADSHAYSRKDLRHFQHSIIDNRSKLNRNFKKIRRRKTKYIIVHTSELGLKSTLRVVSKGKHLRSGKRTAGGHAHYVIARNGRTYRILDKRYKADHAGLSMWNGESDISSVSIGIELTGYHYASISDRQYRSVGMLIDILQKVYNLDDHAVLTHSQVAYGKPNRWIKKDHRGRKRCAKNFIRARAGVSPVWTFDPDVRSGRLTADTRLAKVFYVRRVHKDERDEGNVVSSTNTAWSIAGDDYDAETTVYKFPDGRRYTGDQIADAVGWNGIPVKTTVLLNQENGIPLTEADSPIRTITDGLTAWSIAGKMYNHKTTIYFLPSGRMKTGSGISDWDDLPERTKLIIGYQGPYKLDANRSSYEIAGPGYRNRNTIYYLPSRELLAGDEIKDFTKLPAGTLMFLPST